MSNTQAWSVILGVITPLLIAVVNRKTWSDQMRRIAAIVVSVVVAVGNLVFNGDITDWKNWVVNIALVAGAAQVLYATVFKPTGIADKVDQKTS